jgi:hypothetical protein
MSIWEDCSMDDVPTAAAAVTQDDPDAELVRIEAEIMAMTDSLKAAAQAYTAAEKTMIAWRAANPMPAERSEQWEQAEAAAKRACRYGEVEAEWNAWLRKEDALLDKLIDTPATTLSSMRVKARISLQSDDSAGGDIARSIAEDILDLGSCSEPDPIFVAIERHRAALAAYDDFCKRSEQAKGSPNLNDDLADRFKKHEEALTDLLDQKPTSADGCAAVLRYVYSLVTDEGGEITSEPARWFFRGWHPPVTFLANIAAALEGWVN